MSTAIILFKEHNAILIINFFNSLFQKKIRVGGNVKTPTVYSDNSKQCLLITNHFK